MVDSAEILRNVMTDAEWKKITEIKGYLNTAKAYVQKAHDLCDPFAESGRRAMLGRIIDHIEDTQRALMNVEKEIVYKYFTKEVEGK